MVDFQKLANEQRAKAVPIVTTVAALPAACAFAAEKNMWYIDPDSVPEMVALIHSEASEALESFRNGEPISWTQCKECYLPSNHEIHNMQNENAPACHPFEIGGKPCGIASEFADIVIRVAHYCAVLKINLADEIQQKLNYNATRGHRHGGKKI